MNKILCLFLFCFVQSLGLTQDLSQITYDDSIVVIIDSLRVEGNDHVKDNVVFAESQLHIGDTIQILRLRDELLKSRQNILNTKLFNAVELVINNWEDNNHISIDFVVDERWYIYPIPIVRLKGITFNQWSEDFDNDLNRLTYGLDLKHNNFTKNGDPLVLKMAFGFEENYEFDYFMPNLTPDRNWGIGFSGAIAQDKGTTVSANNNDLENVLYDDVALVSNSGGIRIRKRKTINKMHTVGVGYNHLEANKNILDTIPDYFTGGASKLNYWNIYYNYFSENRDLKEYPLKGEYWDLTATYLGLTSDDYQQLSVEGRYSYFRPLKEKLFFASGLLARYSPIYEDNFYSLTQLRIGRRYQARGFNDYQFFPASYITSKSELKYRIMDKQLRNVPILPDRFEPVPMKIYPKAFFDMSKYFMADFDQNNELNNRFLFAGGLGVDVVTIYNTVLRLELSQNNIGETKFNFAVGKPF